MGEIAKALKALGDQGKVLKASSDQDKALGELRHAAAEFQNMRNAMAHASANVPGIGAVKPAYTLDEEDSDG